MGQTPLLEQPAARLVLAYLWLRIQPAAQVHLESVLGVGKGRTVSGRLAALRPT